MRDFVTIDRATLEQLVRMLEQCLDDAIQAQCDLEQGYSKSLALAQMVQVELSKEALTAGRAALAKAEPIGWQAIETAPKDFTTMFDGWNGERVCDVQWARPEYAPKDHYAWCYSEYENGYGWVNHEAKGLTHWMPLPAAPKDTL